jgi:methyl-accepting chemotaxis protein
MPGTSGSTSVVTDVSAMVEVVTKLYRIVDDLRQIAKEVGDVNFTGVFSPAQERAGAMKIMEKVAEMTLSLNSQADSLFEQAERLKKFTIDIAETDEVSAESFDKVAQEIEKNGHQTNPDFGADPGIYAAPDGPHSDGASDTPAVSGDLITS